MSAKKAAGKGKTTRKRAAAVLDLGEAPRNLILVEGEEQVLRSRSVEGIVGRVQTRWVRVPPGAEAGDLEWAVTPSLDEERAVSLLISERDPSPGWGVVLSEVAKLARVVVVEFQGDLPDKSPLGVLAGKLPPGQRFKFPAGKPWEARARAASFARSELARHGVRDEGAADALVRAGVVDLGRVGMECQKVAWYCAATRQPASAAVVDAVDPMSGRSDVDDLATALGDRHLGRVASALEGVRRGGADPVPRVAAVVSRCAYQWLCAASHGGSDEEVGRALGVHPYVVKIKVRAAATRWGVRGAADLLEAAARADHVLRAGGRNPWAVLCAGVLRATARVGAPASTTRA